MLSFLQYLADGTRVEVATHGGNDAEAAAMVAALGNLEVGVVLRRELDSLGRHQVGERVVRFLEVLVHCLHHAVSVVRAGDREHAGVGRLHHACLGAQAAGDDDLAVLLQRLADGVEGFLDRGVDEAAGVDDDQVGAGVVRRGDIPLSPELGEDPLRIYKCLGTAERDKPDFRTFYRDRLAAEGNRGK